jgi:hypothetical protein
LRASQSRFKRTLIAKPVRSSEAFYQSPMHRKNFTQEG